MAMCAQAHCDPWPYGPAIAAMAADILGQALVTPALPFYLSPHSSRKVNFKVVRQVRLRPAPGFLLSQEKRTTQHVM